MILIKERDLARYSKMRQVTYVTLIVIALIISTQIHTQPISYSREISSEHESMSLLLEESKIKNKFSFAESTSLIWNFTYGGADWDILHSVIECSSGGYLAAGYTYSFGAGGADVFVLRLAENGTLLWNRTYGGPFDEKAYSVIECDDGGFALAGLTTSYGAGGSDAWLLRINESGIPLWNYTYGGPNYDEAWSLLQRDDGSFALGGTYSHETDGWDMWLILTNESGGYEVDYRFGGPFDDVCYSMIECTNGGFALVGYTNSYGSGQYDYYLVRAGEDGAFYWNRTYGSTWFDEAAAIIECISGGFAIIGETKTSPDAISNTWLVRTDDQGYQLWNKTYTFGQEHARSYSLLESDDDDLVFTSCFNDIYVARVNDSGSMIWYKLYSFDLYNIAWAMIESSNHGFIVVGYAAHLYGGPKAHLYDALVLHVADLPRWYITPTNLTIEFAQEFTYQLMAKVPHGADHWWLDDTEEFGIDEKGLVYNITFISVGEYLVSGHVNDTLGNVLTTTFRIEVVDTKPPTWIQEPENQTLITGDLFRYDLNASDPSGIALWTIDDSVNFDIDENGVITNRNSLAAGIYDLEVEVEDPYGNTLDASFTITVLADNIGFVIVITVMVALIVSIIVVIYRRRKNKNSTHPL
jgi:hypothetical protein